MTTTEKNIRVATNVITITTTVTMGAVAPATSSEVRTSTKSISGETRREAMTLCTRYVREFSQKLVADGWNVVPVTKIDFSATKVIQSPEGPMTVNTAFEARWDTRKNKLVSAADEGFKSLTVGVASRDSSASPSASNVRSARKEKTSKVQESVENTVRELALV